jgi:spore germination cell wall hydrolase CwlJ-like protein
MVFETPKPADAQVLTEMPRTEVVVAAPQPVAPVVAPKQVEKPAPVTAPVQQASLAAEPSPAEFPKSVMIVLPLPKPPLSPAQRLELAGKEYDKAEKCLAQAIYFEARNEPARGQQAVAQVVLNRVFSPYYPKDVCSVVYQNAHRHLSCQFTFACDGKPESVNERGAWARANRIAKQTLDAKVWLPEVNKATHYHAAYVRPNWIRDMKVMVRYGLHTFYRPRNWGDGSNEAHWGTASNSVKPVAVAAAKPAATPAKPVAAAKKIAPASRKAYAR